MNTAEMEKKCADLQLELDKLKAWISSPLNFPKMVKLPDRSYEVSQTPVTVGQYRDFCEATGRTLPAQPAPEHPDNPVVNVTFKEAQEYTVWLSEMQGGTYRLPTEDEFEHYCGDHLKANEESAVYDQPTICRVGTKKANEYGLHDVLGLVWEFTESHYE